MRGGTYSISLLWTVPSWATASNRELGIWPCGHLPNTSTWLHGACSKEGCCNLAADHPAARTVRDHYMVGQRGSTSRSSRAWYGEPLAPFCRPHNRSQHPVSGELLESSEKEVQVDDGSGFTSSSSPRRWVHVEGEIWEDSRRSLYQCVCWHQHTVPSVTYSYYLLLIFVALKCNCH